VKLTPLAKGRDRLPIHNPLPSTPIRRTRLVPLTPLRRPCRPLPTIPVAALVVPTVRALHAAQPIPLLLAALPRTLVIRAVPTALAATRGTVPTPCPPARPLTAMLLAELPAAAPPLPAALCRRPGPLTPVLAAERRHVPVVVHVAASRAVRPAAAPVQVAEAPRVAGLHVLGTLVVDLVSAVGVLARVGSAVLAAARRVAGPDAVRAEALVCSADGGSGFADGWAVGGDAAVWRGG
jgi:hypothetical protein